MVVVPHDDDVFAEGGEDVLALELDVLIAPDADPAAGEPGFLLVVQDVGVVIDRWRQEGGAAEIPTRFRDISR